MTHTNTEQPEALRLAECLEKHVWQATPLRLSKVVELSADELRRLHARVQELEEQTAHMADLVELSDYATKKLEASQSQRVPLSVVDAIKQGLQADEATRHHCRGTTNWAAAMTRFYERAHGITQEKQG